MYYLNLNVSKSLHGVQVGILAEFKEEDEGPVNIKIGIVQGGPTDVPRLYPNLIPWTSYIIALEHPKDILEDEKNGRPLCYIPYTSMG